MKPTNEFVLILSSVKDMEFTPIHIIETLERFDISWEYTSAPIPAQVSFDSVYCVICIPEVARFAHRRFRTTPILVVPHTTNVSQSLETLVHTSSQPLGQPCPIFALGKAGEINAALFAVSILALKREDIRKRLARYRKEQTKAVLARPIPGE